MRFTVPSTTKRSLQEGQAIVLIALLILVLFGMLGLAVDSGRGYVDRRDQQTAVDAAALAAGDWYESFPDRIDLLGKVIPNSVTLYQNNLRIYSPCSQVYYNSGTTGLGFPDDNWTFQCPGQYSLQIEAINTQFNGYDFTYKSTHQLPLAFIQIFGGATNITIAAQASAIVGNQRQTPALLTLNPNGPCSTLMHGNGQLTLYGDAYSNGPVCLDNNLGIAGNCYAVSGSCNAATYLCYTALTGNPYQPPCRPGDIQGAPFVPAPTLPDPQYLAPERAFYTGAGQSYDRGTWTEMTPGTWNNFYISSNGCYFLDAGVYTWNGGYTSHGGLVSNELKAPGEAAYTAPGTGTLANPTFWGGGGGCDGSFTTTVVPAVGQGIKHQGASNQGYWGVELTSVRYDRFLDYTMSGNPCYGGAGCMRESAPSICQEVNEIDANNLGIAVTIVNNAPGAQYYNVYINPNGCLPRVGTNLADFSFYGTFLAPGWTDGGAPPAISAGVGPWTGVLSGGRNGWSCTLPLVTICNIQYNNFHQPADSCPYYSARGVNCWAPYYESPPQCFPNVCAANTAPQENAAMSLEYWPSNGGDLANENYCMQTPISPAGDPNAPCSSAKITPGAVQFYLPAGNNCVDQNGNGSTHVFSGEQYNWIIIYEASSLPGSPAGTYCSGTGQKLDGNSYTQYIGTIYSPTSSWDIQGANTAPLAGQVIAWSATVTGNGNAGILFNPNYSPAPPAARLIN
jgi:hypothetical protein